MKKLLLPLLFLPLMFGFVDKNTVKTEAFSVNQSVLASSIVVEDAETFKTYWEDDFRKNNPEVCNIPLAAYKEMYGYYRVLSKEDQMIVNATNDVREPDYTIGQIIRTLVNKYETSNAKMRSNKQKFDQSDIIIIATVVALVGATAISVLFILRNNKVIK